MSADRAKHMLGELVAELDESSRDLNEATTRHHYIDRLIHEALSWPNVHVTCEDPVPGGGYTDYILGSPAKLAVIEAKKEGTYFSIPAGMENTRIVSLELLMGHSPANKNAINQVVDYALRAGLPVAAITNGHEMVAFLGSRQDGISPYKGKAVLYSSPKQMLERFSEFWDYLSEPGLKSGNLRRALSSSNTSAPPPEKLSAHIPGYPGFRNRSELETDLSTLADLFLVDLMQEREVSDEFIRDCYCPSGALSQYSSVSREILKHRYDALTGAQNITPVAGKKGVSPSITAEAVSAAMSRRPIVLVGDVGVGKTFFLRRLVRVEAVDLLKNTKVIYVDFLRESLLLKDVSFHLASEVRRVLRNELGIRIDDADMVRRIYKRELDDLSRGIYGVLRDSDPSAYQLRELQELERLMSDDIEHVRRSLELIRKERSQDFLLILDNVDHHIQEFQEQIFVIGQSLAQKWPVTVFISLRPDTFHTSRKSGSLAAYQPRVFAVPPPRVDLVIQKRLEFARKQLEESGRLESFPQGLTIDSANLLAYLDVLLDAFTQRDDFIRLIDNMSSGNVRRALEMISQFVGSGYVSIRRILELHNHGSRYTMPLHEFLRALLFGEGDYYDPRASHIPNVFDLEHSDGREHFLSAILLSRCELAADPKNHGYVSPETIIAHCQEIGYSAEQVSEYLRRCVDQGLLQHSTEGSGDYRITQAGGYMRKTMISTFAYLDAVIVDVPILDTQYRGKILDVSLIQDRLDRAIVFLDYLDEQWSTVGEGPLFSWPDTSARARSDIDTARVKAERAQSRR